jgi:SAM-dependent methyltransferase
LFNKKNIKILDVGCGRGQFIYLMQKKGWLVHGTETSSTSAMAAKKKVGDDAILINKDLEKLKNIDTCFDIITFWHVLEHLNEPKKMVNLIEKKLINKGYVVVEVPNFESFQHLINKNSWIHLDCPRHVTHFTKKGLINFFDNKKFKIIKSSTLSFEYGFYGMLQSLLNLFIPVPNYLFFLIRKKNAKIAKISFIKNYLSLFLTITLFIPLLIVSIIFELIAVILKKGGALRIVIQKM